MEEVWLIGDDLGDLVYFYAKGKAGYGIYRTDAGDHAATVLAAKSV